MTATTAPLIALVQQWERRRQWGITLQWLPRTFMPGLLIGLVLVGFARFRPALPDAINLTIAGVAILIGILVMVGLIWLRPRPLIAVARRFDRHFGLKERLSTALELMDGTITGDADLSARQLQDAESAALALSPTQELPLHIEIREWLIVLALLGGLLFLLVLPPALSTPDEVARQRAAIDTSAEAVEEILRDVAASPDLTQEQREPLLEALQTQLETLRDPNVSMDEAFASLSEIEQQLDDAAQALRDQMLQQEQANEQALNALRGNNSQEQPQTLEQAMQQTQQGIPQMSPEQMSQTADALEQAAQALESTDPQTAQALQDAAEALRDGDMQAAQEALQRAMENQPQRGQQSQSQQSQLEQLERNAEAASQAQQEAAEQAESESSESPPSGEGEQEGQEGQGQGQGEGEETGTEPGDGDTPAIGPGDDAELGSQQSSQLTSGQQGLGGDGAGDGEASLGDDATERLQTRNPNLEEPSNNPDGRGEGEYEAIFAPRFSVEGTGDDTVELAADPGELPMEEGEFQDNPFGESVVPYSQVFSDYADSATRDLESDYIPLGLRDVVRQYFSSLDPEGR